MLDKARSIPVFDDLELEIERRAVAFNCMQRAPLDTHVEAARELIAWAHRTFDPPSASGVESWTGFVWYRKGDFDRAIETFALGTRDDVPIRYRAAALGNTVMAMVERQRFDEALEYSRRGLELVTDRRRSHNELRFRSMILSIEYALGLNAVPDDDLIQAVELLGVPSTAATTRLTSAAIEWRNGDQRQARSHALASADHFRTLNMPFGACLAHALACAAGDFVTEEDVERWMTDALAGPPNVARQAAALFAIAGTPWTGEVPPPLDRDPALRAEVFSEHEVAAALRTSTP